MSLAQCGLVIHSLLVLLFLKLFSQTVSKL